MGQLLSNFCTRSAPYYTNRQFVQCVGSDKGIGVGLPAGLAVEGNVKVGPTAGGYTEPQQPAKVSLATNVNTKKARFFTMTAS